VSGQDTEVPTRKLILFVAGASPRSERARANLRRALSRAGVGAAQVDEIDLLERPEATLEHGIYATPALIGAGGPDAAPMLYGDLSEEAKLNRFIAEILGEAGSRA